MANFQELIDGWIRGDIEPAPVGKLIGFRLTDFQDGIARVELEVSKKHHNPMGFVHGGILCDLADAAMGVVVASGLIKEETFSTLQLTIAYFRPVQIGKLVAIAKSVSLGKSVVGMECEISNEEDKLIAKASSTCLKIRRV